MTRNQIIERCARTIAEKMGDDPDKIAPLPSSDYYDAATAFVDMLGPRAIQWVSDDPGCEGLWGNAFPRNYQVRPVVGGSWKWRVVDSVTWYIGVPTLEAAKAAAQAHHEEQHWMRTRIWEDD